MESGRPGRSQSCSTDQSLDTKSKYDFMFPFMNV
jgi:hypothetical protein